MAAKLEHLRFPLLVKRNTADEGTVLEVITVVVGAEEIVKREKSAQTGAVAGVLVVGFVRRRNLRVYMSACEADGFRWEETELVVKIGWKQVVVTCEGYQPEQMPESGPVRRKDGSLVLEVLRTLALVIDRVDSGVLEG